MAKSSADQRSLESLEVVLTVERLKKTRLSQLLKQATLRVTEQKNLFNTLVEYGEEYREKISAMDRRGQSLASDKILQRQNLLAMINQVEGMKVAQDIQVKAAEAELYRSKIAFHKSHFYIGKLEELEADQKSVLQNKKIKREDQSSGDEFLTRFSARMSITNAP